MKYFVLIFVLVFSSVPAAAETVEELKAQLAAQKQINALLKQRIESLEAELNGRNVETRTAVASTPVVDLEDPEQDRALERALSRRGSAVLPPNTIEVTPNTFWSHTGRDALASKDTVFGGGFDARVGLRGGWMVGATVPVFDRAIDGLGNNTGVGDVSVTVWKSLLTQDNARPSLVGSLRYTAPTGDDFGDAAVPLGAGFHSVTAQLSSVKTVDPIAYFADVSYTAFIDEDISGVNVDRDGTFGFGFGANLAVTPVITVAAGFDFDFERVLEIGGTKVDGTERTIGVFTIGTGVVLNRNLFMTLSAGVGVTEDSPDVSLGMSLPFRF